MRARWLGVLALLVACKKPTAGLADASPPPVAATIDAAPPAPKVNPVEALAGQVSGPLALVSVGGRGLVALADGDARALSLVDPKTLDVVETTKLSGAPSAVHVASGSVFVALADRDEVVELRARAEGPPGLVAVRTLKTAREPLALASAGTELLVLTGLGHALQRFPLATGEAKGEKTVLAREPRGLVVLPSGDVVVGHASEGPLTFVRAGGAVETADLTEPSVCTSSSLDECMTLSDLRATQHYALALLDGRVIASGSLSASKGTGDGSSYGAGGTSSTTFPGLVADDFEGGDVVRHGPARTNRFPTVSLAIDVVAPDTRKVETVAGRRRQGSCVLPRALVVDEAHKEVLVACLGSNKVSRYAIATMRGALVVTDPRGQTPLPGGPVALALLGTGEVVTFARESRHVTVLTRRDKALAVAIDKEIPLPSPRTPEELQIAKGRALFFTADPRISTVGLTCGHCHPDGRDDDVVWTTPAGPRRPLSLVALPQEGPIGWDAKSPTLVDHVRTTITKHLVGRGLEGPDLDALIAYVRSIRPARAEAEVTALREGEGGRAFAKAGCATCHEPAHGYGDGRTHELGTGPAIRTPRLAGLGGRRALFHDGRYPSLAAMLADPKLKMGEPGALTSGERERLVAFLEALD